MVGSEYIIYADESGDHSMKEVYKEHPVFVLAFCIFKKVDYINQIKTAFSQLKFDFWGHDIVVFHSHRIRKQRDEFRILNNLEIQKSFLDELNKAIIRLPFTIVATVIDKRELKERYAEPENPYELALAFCLERAHRFLQEEKQENETTHLVVESRGLKEDKDLKQAFKRISYNQQISTFDIIFADKKVNSAGLQLADLVAHPIGRHVINPEQENRAFDTLEQKFREYPSYVGRGLKIFPTLPVKRKTSAYAEA